MIKVVRASYQITGEVPMDHNEKWQAVDAQRTRLADLLDTLSDVEWTYPSLCEGWTVHDVATHVAVAPYASIGTVLKAAAKARGNFNRMIYALTKEEAAKRSPGEVIGMLRGAVGLRRL